MITKEQETLIFIALGEASMSWVERPKGEFDSVNCERIGNELIKKLNQLKQQKMELDDKIKDILGRDLYLRRVFNSAVLEIKSLIREEAEKLNQLKGKEEVHKGLGEEHDGNLPDSDYREAF